jgi:hypothetical protein
MKTPMAMRIMATVGKLVNEPLLELSLVLKSQLLSP